MPSKWEKCPECGTKNDMENQSFCPRCGTLIVSGKYAAQPAGEADRPCENCGEPISQHLYGSQRICKNGEWNNWGRGPRR